MASLTKIQTYTGIKFDFIDPTPDQVDIKDIAFSLANQCRFGGHVPFFSVAEHSVAVAARLPPRLQLAGLLHDAAEAYLGDVPSPLKAHLPNYQKLEHEVQNAIYEAFSVVLSDEDVKAIKQADLDATYTEAHFLLKDKGKDWVPILFSPRAEYTPRCIPPPEAVKMFMYWAGELTNKTLENELIIVNG